MEQEIKSVWIRRPRNAIDVGQLQLISRRKATLTRREKRTR